MPFASSIFKLDFQSRSKETHKILKNLYLKLGFQYSVLHMEFIKVLEIKSVEHCALPSLFHISFLDDLKTFFGCAMSDV